MPRYIYACDACRGEFEITHGMFHEQRHCILCKRVDTLRKIPTFRINTEPSKNLQEKNKPGKVVDEFIKEAKKELREQKKDLKKEEMQ